MKNFKVTAKEDNKEYWISRAIAVTGCIICRSRFTEEPVYLISKRGSGCPDHIGEWQFNCGYLDWDETLDQAVKRELYEELGLRLDTLPVFDLTQYQIISDPTRDARQNVSVRYKIEVALENIVELINAGTINPDTQSRGGEANEIADIALIHFDERHNYDWAFNHKELLEDIHKSNSNNKN